ncbi:hypothetical protein EYF80_028218 [Liparis tanakae]|uniref:Uncharacterized protein n=1 Tax=Liparis tanakae TaxID=230148 RepID=A0A4Z2H772_9TELE|nr:hypothetical protein EYF80_028218 [Liparis tanakae]
MGPSHCTWPCVHSSRSEFSFSRTPSLTWEHSSSARSRASLSGPRSAWQSGQGSGVELAGAEADVRLHVGELRSQQVPDQLNRHVLPFRLLADAQRSGKQG